MNAEMNKCKEVIMDFLVQEYDGYAADVDIDVSNPRHIELCRHQATWCNEFTSYVYVNLVARCVIKTRIKNATGEINVPFVHAFCNLQEMANWMRRGNLDAEWLLFEAEGYYYLDEFGVTFGSHPYDYEEED